MKKHQIYKQLIAEYDRKRMTALLEFDIRRQEVYAKLPEIKDIDEKIAALGFKASFAALSSPDEAELAAKKFEKACTKLTDRKYEVLENHGIPKKYLEIYYNCKDCKDSGFIGVDECKCFTAKRIEMAYSQYSVKEKLASENFECFDFRLFSDELYKDYNISPKTNMEKIYKYCEKYTKSFNTSCANLMFYGNPGLGKTFLCNCISKELLDKGFLVLYFTAFQLFRLLDDVQFGRIEDGQSVMDDILNSDLLVIDDIGTEFTTAVSGAAFFNIIKSRANGRKPVLISTNLYPSEIKETYSERIYSRISGNFTAFELFGEDVGRKKKFRSLLK